MITQSAAHADETGATVRTSLPRVAVIEDHRLQRIGLVHLLTGSGRHRTICSVETAAEFAAWLDVCPVEHRPHLAILDLRVERGPDVEIEFVRGLLASRIRVLVCSAFSNPQQVQRVLAIDAVNAVSKHDTPATVLSAIDATLRGDHWRTEALAHAPFLHPDRPKLSQQEVRALELYASGLSLAATAASMGIGRETAKQYVDRVRAKYAASGIPVHSQFDLARMAWNEGYLEHGLPRT